MLLPPMPEVEALLSAFGNVDVPPIEDVVDLDEGVPTIGGGVLCEVAVVGSFGTATEELSLIAKADEVAPSADVDTSV